MNPDNCAVKTLSLIPVVCKSHKQRLWFLKLEVHEGIKYNYVPFVNLPVLKELFAFVFSFLNALIWNIRKPQKNAAVICDTLNLSVSAGALLACKLSDKTIIGIVTDLPGLMVVGQTKRGLKSMLFEAGVSFLLTRFSGYVLLTEQMNQVGKPA